MLYFFLCIVISIDMDLERFKSDIIPLRQKLLRHAVKIVGNEDDAEDIVQEVFLKLWNIRKQLFEISNPEGFAMQMLKNTSIDKLRVRKTTVDVNEIQLNVSTRNPYLEIEETDSVLIIKQIIAQLPELQQCIIHMRDIEGYELSEIAEITGTHISAVTVNLSRARKKVRDQFIKINNYKLTGGKL
jgi:RNA polymerase sigma factor, sigma-70 family